MNKMIKQFNKEYAAFSNFYPCAVHFEGLNYPTTEHAFQAAKSKNGMDRRIISELSADQAGEAKRLGRQVVLRKDWSIVNISIMKRLLMQKFSYDNFKELLLSTGDEHIVEGNYWHDNFWGDCYCKKCKDIEGQNNLGKLIMKVRELIKNDQVGGSI